MRISDWRSDVCSSDLSVTRASREVPIMLGLRLFLPESWTSDEARMVKAGVPAPFRPYRTKPAIAIEEIDRVIAAGVRFGCVLADDGYGLSASFHEGLSTSGLHWAVGDRKSTRLNSIHYCAD